MSGSSLGWLRHAVKIFHAGGEDAEGVRKSYVRRQVQMLEMCGEICHALVEDA